MTGNNNATDKRGSPILSLLLEWVRASSRVKEITKRIIVAIR